MRKLVGKAKKAVLEKLWFNIRMNRLSGSRIRLSDPQTNEHISFIEDEVIDLNKIPSEHHFEVMWLKDCLDFNRAEFGCDVLQLRFGRLMLPATIYEEMRSNWYKAQELGVEYSPMTTMLNALKAENDRIKNKLKKR